MMGRGCGTKGAGRRMRRGGCGAENGSKGCREEDEE